MRALHSLCVEVTGQLARVSSLLPGGRIQPRTSDLLIHVFTGEPSRWPRIVSLPDVNVNAEGSNNNKFWLNAPKPSCHFRHLSAVRAECTCVSFRERAAVAVGILRLALWPRMPPISGNLLWGQRVCLGSAAVLYVFAVVHSRLQEDVQCRAPKWKRLCGGGSWAL